MTTTHSAFEFIESSLLHIQSKGLAIDLSAMTKEALQFLVDSNLVAQIKKCVDGCDSKADNKDDNNLILQVTDLGRATFKGLLHYILLLVFVLFLFSLIVTLITVLKICTMYVP